MQLTGTLMIPDTPADPVRAARENTRPRVRLAYGSITIEDGRIADITIDRTKEDGPLEAPLICPAFTDLHVHLPQFDLMGAHGFELLDWLNRFVFPAEMKWADTEYAAAMTHRVIDQLFAVGTTGIGAYATVHHDAAMRAMAVCDERKMRGRIGQVLMDREAPPELLRPSDELLKQCEATLEFKAAREKGGGRVAGAVTPRFAISCTQRLLRGAGDLAAEHEAVVQTHLSENRAECDLVRHKFGVGYIDVYEQTGLLNGRAIHGHGVLLDRRDRDVLRRTDTIIAHCPTANSFLMSGRMDPAALESSGVRVGLGSDIGAGYDRAMPRVARAMIENAATFGRVIRAAEAWHTITAGNAALLGWNSCGAIVADHAADLLVIRPDIAWQAVSGEDALSMLMFAWDDRWIEQTLAAGEAVYERG